MQKIFLFYLSIIATLSSAFASFCHLEGLEDPVLYLERFTSSYVKIDRAYYRVDIPGLGEIDTFDKSNIFVYPNPFNLSEKKGVLITNKDERLHTVFYFSRATTDRLTQAIAECAFRYSSDSVVRRMSEDQWLLAINVVVRRACALYRNRFIGGYDNSTPLGTLLVYSLIDEDFSTEPRLSKLGNDVWDDFCATIVPVVAPEIAAHCGFGHNPVFSDPRLICYDGRVHEVYDCGVVNITKVRRTADIEISAMLLQ